MLKLEKHIILIGMPGCGKTTIGKRLAKEINANFIDMDHYLVEKEGRTINEIFQQDGEDIFRELETSAIRNVSIMQPSIISTGGGVIKKKKNIDLLRDNGILFFINRPLDNIISDIDIESRPLLKDHIDNLKRLYEERYDLYNSYCHYNIVNDRDVGYVVREILGELSQS